MISTGFENHYSLIYIERVIFSKTLIKEILQQSSPVRRYPKLQSKLQRWAMKVKTRNNMTATDDLTPM